MRARFLLPFLVAAIAVLLHGRAFAGQVAEESPRVGYLAPAFSGVLIDGRPVSLGEYRGKAVLLNFWATWCAPCRDELPELNSLAASLPTTHAVVIGVTQDTSQTALAEFLEAVPVTFPIVMDKGRNIGRAYHARALPISFLIDAEGRILEHIMGPRDWAKPMWREKLLQASQSGKP